MTLNFNSQKCKPFSTPQNDREDVVRETLIMGGMITGINEITEKNWMEAYARIHLYEMTFGTWTQKMNDNEKWERVFIEPEEVKRWIGLYTNVSKLTRTQFLKIFSRELDSIVYQVQKSELNKKGE